jgi:hypothetical protein
MLLDEQEVALNLLLGSQLHLKYEGEIHCVACGNKTRKSFNQGYCFPCVRSLAQCDICIVRPEKCHFQQGSCREPEWAMEHCMQDHYVYLANTSGIKVGITRHSQIPTRWIDQGAVQALPVMRVSNRLQSGLVETLLARQVADKTNWRKMLKNEVEVLDLPQLRDQLLRQSESEMAELLTEIGGGQVEFLAEETPVSLQYPVELYPTKITSLNFDKNPDISGKLLGIKGQYLILDTGVLNIRKFAGYLITLDY